MSNRKDAAEKVRTCLRKYLDDAGAGPWPPINPGHPVHDAICSLEKFYEGRRLPVDAGFPWVILVQGSRSAQGVSNGECGSAGEELILRLENLE